MTLGSKQKAFSRLVAKLITDLYHRGYEVTFSEAWRSPETCALYAKQGRGIAGSLHQHRLAIDLNLFKDGEFLTMTQDYKEMGEIWEGYSTEEFECCWGGRFDDGGHVSIGHGGVR